jgi:murein DD-endopeptidase MepM/ murein hydrolase activator NlpD
MIGDRSRRHPALLRPTRALVHRTRALATAVALAATLVPLAAAAPAAAEVRPLCFPVVDPVTYTDTFGQARGGGRSHEGTDIMGQKGHRLVAAVTGTVVDVRGPGEPYTDYSVRIRADDGWYYAYLHMNNDTPGTDDGQATWSQVFAPGIIEGARVRAGDLLGYMGDSGNAESAGAHLHFEMRQPAVTVWQSVAVNAYDSLRAASRCNAAASVSGWHLRDRLGAGGDEVAFDYGMSNYTPLVGDWDGDGQDSAGIWEPSTAGFHLRDELSGGPADHVLAYGDRTYTPLAGDWNGDGVDTIGVWDPASATFHLRNSVTGGPPDASVAYGAGSFVPVVGDWDGDGTDTIGVWDPAASTFHLRNSLTPGWPDRSVTISSPGTIPVVGDLDGDGIDTVGTFAAGRWRIATSNVASPTIHTYTLGAGSDRPVIGDWNGGGLDSLGYVGAAAPSRPAPAGRTWYLRDANTPGSPHHVVSLGTTAGQPVAGDWDGAAADGPAVWDRIAGDLRLQQTATSAASTVSHRRGPRAVSGRLAPGTAEVLGGFADGRWLLPGLAPFAYGVDGWTPLLGDWNGDGVDTVGVWDPATSTFYLRDSNTPGPPDHVVAYGVPGWRPVVGDWNGDGVDTIGIWEPATANFYLRDQNTGGPPSVVAAYGAASYTPVVGDWNGDGTDTIGVIG